MAGKVGGGSGKGMQPNSEPNVIPFIDIMLVMLIIFMVAAPLPTVDIKVDLPPPGKVLYEEPLDKPTTIVLLDRGGQLEVWVGSTYTTKQTFDETLLRVARENNQTLRDDYAKLFAEAKIFVDADQSTTYENVIGLINDVDSAGFKKVSLLVKGAEG
jgi:biopolymer transport protein ExbD